MQIHDWRRIYGQVGGATVNFEASDQDTANTIGKAVAGHSFQFYGFESSDGAWIIMQFDTTDATTDVAYRYCGGTTHAGYLVAWAARDTITYEFYSEVTIP